MMMDVSRPPEYAQQHTLVSFLIRHDDIPPYIRPALSSVELLVDGMDYSAVTHKNAILLIKYSV